MARTLVFCTCCNRRCVLSVEGSLDQRFGCPIYIDDCKWISIDGLIATADILRKSLEGI